MKKLTRLMTLTLAVLMLMGMLASHAEIIPAHGFGQIGLQAVVLCDKLTLRQSPNASAKAVETLKYRDLIIVTEQTDGWARVVTGDSEDASSGWVNSDYIAIDPAWYRTEKQTPVYAWKDLAAPKLALLNANTMLLDIDTYLAILKDEGDWILVSLRGAAGWIYIGSGRGSDSGSSTQHGDRYPATVVLEGMEETVWYEQVRNESIGFEMGYEYETFTRQSTADRERFISIYDDVNYPENFLEVTRSSEDAETAAASVKKALSLEYEVGMEWTTLEKAGSCIRLNASEVKGGGRTPDQFRTVYVIPTANGSIIAAAHYSFEAADGFGARFRGMMNTFVPIG